MPLDDSAISLVRATKEGAHLVVTWSSTAPAGTVYQVYADGALAWHGTAKKAVLPTPPSRYGSVDVFACPAAEGRLDLGAAIARPRRRATLTWSGGSYLGDAVEGFRVYQGASPGAAPVLAGKPAADFAVYPGGVVLDGFGVGAFGAGGFGRSASTYTWTSQPLAPGTWHFAVTSYDVAGNESPPWSAAVTVAAPPHPPARDARGARVYGSLAGTTLTLTWNPPEP